jgi:phosphoglycolate phosphatase
VSGFRRVVFDFDGTLVDSNRIKKEAFLRSVRDHPGGEECMREVLDTVLGDRHEVFAAYVARQQPPSSVQELLLAFNTDVDSAVAGAQAMPGAEVLLQALRAAGVAVALSSATPRQNLVDILARRGWSGWFDAVAGSPMTKTATLQRLMRADELVPSDVAVVGDGADDRASAIASGCTFFSVGEARGAHAGEPIYTLPALQALLVPIYRNSTTCP